MQISTSLVEILPVSTEARHVSVVCEKDIKVIASLSLSDATTNIALATSHGSNKILNILVDVNKGLYAVSPYGTASINIDVISKVKVVTPLNNSSPSTSTIGSASNPYDFVVYGATFEGCMAAVAAKKCGATVLLIEPRDMVGGMVTNGIQFADSYVSASKIRSNIGGMTDKFYAILADMYNEDQQTYFQADHYSAESHKAQLAINRMLKTANINVHKFGQLVTGSVVRSIAASNNRIVSASFTNYGVIYSKNWHDATYTGDLLAESGCTFIVGRESETQYSEATYNAGTNQQAANIPTNPIDPYVIPGNPASGLIPFVKPYAIQAKGTASQYQQANGFRICISSSATDKVPFYTLWGGAANVEAPYADYDPTQYEILRRHAIANGSGWTAIGNVLLLQTAIPSDYNNKYDVNHTGFMSLDYIDPDITREYVTASWTRRAEIEAMMRKYTIGLIYFLLNDTSLPAALRTNVGTYGLSKTEYNGGLPFYMYVRQGRRLVGDLVISAPLIATSTAYTNPAALAYYTFDNHGVQYLNNGGHVELEGGCSGGAGQGSKIPCNVLWPKRVDCVNLTAGFCGSTSNAAFSSVRVEPCLGMLGEAAGVIGALAALNNYKVQDVPYQQIRREYDLYSLLNYGGATVTTDGTTGDGQGMGNGGTIVTTGTWVTNTGTLLGTVSYDSCALTSGVNSKQFLPTLQRKGMHDVSIRWLDSGSTARGQPTVVVVANGVTQPTITLNQSNSGDGGAEYYLGTYNFNKGDTANNYVTITHNNTTAITSLAWVKFTPSKSLVKLAKAI